MIIRVFLIAVILEWASRGVIVDRRVDEVVTDLGGLVPAQPGAVAAVPPVSNDEP